MGKIHSKILLLSIIFLGMFLLFLSPIKISAAVPTVCPTTASQGVKEGTDADATVTFYADDCGMTCYLTEYTEEYYNIRATYKYMCTQTLTNIYKGGAETTAEKVDLGDKFNKIYKWGIGIVGVLSFIMITYGGILYMVSGAAVDKKSKAKGVIQNALIGLLLALTSYMILNIINPQTLSFGLKLEDVKVEYEVEKEVKEEGKYTRTEDSFKDCLTFEKLESLQSDYTCTVTDGSCPNYTEGYYHCNKK